MNEIDAKVFLQNMIIEINTQDNRSTATPFFYVIRSRVWVSAYNEGEGDRVVFVNNNDPEDQIKEESLQAAINAYREEMLEYEEDFEKTDSEIEDILSSEYSEHWENKAWEERNCFFTEKEAELHLKANYYHYSRDAHTYVKHFWRAPDVKKFFEAVGDLCGVKYERK